ncbi:uncharacterized protein PADG_00899 [Paracoccidioides brasiliensis Pb18]|uniref:Uncharacterized protein n=1 Tax=Paracoccidioides brasiliensis (strain Pb18) TaxID=502780 RepID=C1FYM3_PARBD|nr:uncharacterized protein PADG_00899 [Paracoccidioides brasiliensis Pb18]EEH44610.2 hypothetical protein PADG_00899 [Paracoccidioides brasiliensis Pb18]
MAEVNTEDIDVATVMGFTEFGTQPKNKCKDRGTSSTSTPQHTSLQNNPTYPPYPAPQPSTLPPPLPPRPPFPTSAGTKRKFPPFSTEQGYITPEAYLQEFENSNTSNNMSPNQKRTGKKKTQQHGEENGPEGAEATTRTAHPHRHRESNVNRTPSPTTDYQAPNGTVLTPQELRELKFGVRNQNGDMVYFQPSFIEDDPWAELEEGED